MMNLLHDMCVQTSRLARIQKQIELLDAEAREIIVQLALHASQCATLAQEESANKNRNTKDN